MRNMVSLVALFVEFLEKDRDLTDDGEDGKRAVKYLKDSVDFAVKIGAKLIIVVPSPVGRTTKPIDITIEKLTENA